MALALMAVAFLRKIAIEERFMAEAFGPAYAAYSRATPPGWCRICGEVAARSPGRLRAAGIPQKLACTR